MISCPTSGRANPRQGTCALHKAEAGTGFQTIGDVALGPGSSPGLFRRHFPMHQGTYALPYTMYPESECFVTMRIEPQTQPEQRRGIAPAIFFMLKTNSVPEHPARKRKHAEADHSLRNKLSSLHAPRHELGSAASKIHAASDGTHRREW